MSEPEITNPEKTEKPKNPKSVERVKRLAAISREAKERKKRQQEKFFEPEGSAEWEWNKILSGIGLIGAAFLAYKIFFDPKTRKEDDEVPEMRKVTEKRETRSDATSQPEPPKEREAKSPAPTPRKTRSTKSYEPYTMD